MNHDLKIEKAFANSYQQYLIMCNEVWDAVYPYSAPEFLDKMYYEDIGSWGDIQNEREIFFYCRNSLT